MNTIDNIKNKQNLRIRQKKTLAGLYTQGKEHTEEFQELLKKAFLFSERQHKLGSDVAYGGHSYKGAVQDIIEWAEVLQRNALIKGYLEQDETITSSYIHGSYAHFSRGAKEFMAWVTDGEVRESAYSEEFDE